jgi:hypothetical protein
MSPSVRAVACRHEWCGGHGGGIRNRAGQCRGVGRRRPKGRLWDIAPEVAAVADRLGMPGAVVDVCDTAAMQSAIDAADQALGADTQESWDAVWFYSRASVVVG